MNHAVVDRSSRRGDSFSSNAAQRAPGSDLRRTADPIAQSIIKVIEEAVVADALGGDQPAESWGVDILDRRWINAEFAVRVHD